MYEGILSKKNYEEYEKTKEYFFNTFIKYGHAKTLKKGIYLTEEYFEKHYGILYSGSIKQVIINTSGEERILFIYRPGEMIGELISTDLQFNTSFLILKDSLVYLIDKDELELTPEFFHAYSISVKRKYAILFLQSSSSYFDDSLGKVANLIYRTAFQCGVLIENDLLQIDYKFSHVEIAELIGVSRVTVTRKLAILKKMGVIEIDKKKIIIKDVKRLQELINA